MDSNTAEQIINLIDKSKSILLLTHAKADCDGLGAMISMYLTLQSMGKEVVAATNDPTPGSLEFLPSINIVQNTISSKNFVITLDISHTPLNKIKYKLADDHQSVNIIVTPSEGRFNPKDISFQHEEGNFDLIITFDTGNLEHLGPIYEENSELFFQIPVVNIDHHASNTDFGKVNMVDVVAASTTEVMLSLLEKMEKKFEQKFLTEDVATLLLAGLITDTGSFQHANTSPRAMEVAARLLDLGARQQEIIKNIYKTKQLSTLKLWGIVLSKVETDPIYRLVWSSISKDDLKEANASAEESEGIIDDLLSNAPGAEIIILFKYNDEGYVSASMRSTTNSCDVGRICAEMGGGGHVRAAGFKRRGDTNLERLIADTLKNVRNYQAKRLNIHPEDVKIILEKSDTPAEKPEEKKEERPMEKPVEKPAESKERSVKYLDFKNERKPAEKPEEKKEERPMEKPAEKPAEPENPENRPKSKRRRPRRKPKTNTNNPNKDVQQNS